MEKEEEKKTVRFLRIYFCALFLTILFCVSVLFSNMEAIQERDSDNTELAYMEYGVELVVVSMTLFCVVWGVKLMSLKKVRKQIAKGNVDYLKCYKVFNLLRFYISFMVVLVGMVFYVLFARQTFLFCGLIGLLVVLYSWPSLERLERETTEMDVEKGARAE